MTIVLSKGEALGGPSAGDTGGSLLPVLAVTGLAREARLAMGPGVETIGAGGNPKRLRAVLADREHPGCRAVISIGIAGALDPTLVPGDVIVARGVRDESGHYAASLDIAERLLGRLAPHSKRVVLAEIAGVDAPILTPSAKKAMFERTGAAAVDMESHVAAGFAAEHGLPFAAIRVICDPADRSLPPFVANALRNNGEVDIALVLASLARGTAKIGSLVRLARDAAIAFSALRGCRGLLGLGLGIPQAHELAPRNLTAPVAA